MEDFESAAAGNASLLQQLVSHWKAYYYRQSGEISESDEGYIEKFAYEVERDFLIDLLVMNLTGKDMMAQGQILKNISKENSLEKTGFAETLSKESKAHMLQIVKSMNDSHLDHTLWNLRKLIHVAQRFDDILHEEQLLREQKRELGSV